MTRTDELIRKWAGKKSADWIAGQAQVTVEWLYIRARQLSPPVSLDSRGAQSRPVNYVRFPRTELEQYQEWLDAIVQANPDVRNKASAIRLAVKREGERSLEILSARTQGDKRRKDQKRCDIIVFVKDYHDQYGCWPSASEIARAIGYRGHAIRANLLDTIPGLVQNERGRWELLPPDEQD